MSKLNETKPWWKSKTIWFNVIVILITALPGSLEHFRHLFSPSAYEVIVGVVALGNTVLRLMTAKPVTV